MRYLSRRDDDRGGQVIDFHASWCVSHLQPSHVSIEDLENRCSPCHAIAPTFEALSKKYTNVNFLKCDVDAARDVASQYSVSAM